jgi:hypothetical protein
MTELDAQPGEWIDTGRYSRKLSKDEVHRLAQEVQAKLSGPGWPDVNVPLREDMIPRRWKHAKLRVEGETPLGYKTVLPDGGIVERVTGNGCPF